MNEEALRLWARRLAPTLSLLATCLGYLLARHYPMMTTEVFILLSGAVVLGVGIGYACERLPDYGVALVCGGLVVVLAVFTFNVFELLSSINAEVISHKSIRYILKFFIVFALPIGLALLIRRDAPLVLSCGMVVFIIGILVCPDRNVLAYGSNETSHVPPHRLVLHIIFDEFAGNSGIGPTFPDGDRLRRNVSTYFVQHGFRLYEGAYSTYPLTEFSIPALFSFTHPIPKDISKKSYAWFKKLHGEGYQIIYIGNETVPLCDDPETIKLIKRCVLYPFMVDLRSIHDSRISPWRKAGRILQVSLLNFPYLNSQMIRYKIITDTHYKSLAPVADARTTLSRDGGDLAIVMHILLPHWPMLYDENCTQHANQWLLEYSSQNKLERLAYERAYAGQVRCALKQLDTILQVVDRRWPDSTVIVNGDHGLRLYPFTSTREDIRLRHAALFAVRAGGVASGVVPQEHNLQTLFALYAGGRQISDSRLLYGDNKSDHNRALAYPK